MVVQAQRCNQNMQWDFYTELSFNIHSNFLFRITDHLGSGEFGTVCKGQWHAMKGTLDVAVKMLNNKVTEKDVVRFLQEAAIMGQFRHPNIVRLHGVVTVGEPVSYGRVERVRREGGREEEGREREEEGKGGEGV